MRFAFKDHDVTEIR